MLALELLAGTVSFAETTDPKTAELERRMDALEREKAARDTNPLLTLLGNHRLGFLLQIQYVHDDSTGLTGQFKGRRGEMGLSGTIIPKMLTYNLVIDPVSLSSKITKDAYINIPLSVLPYFDFKNVEFRIGQFKFPQSFEGRWSSGDLDFGERATVSKTFGDKRDFGFQLSGSNLPLGALKAEYAVGLFNGTGQNIEDNNDNKDFAGRVGFRWDRLWLGVNGYSGKEKTGDRTRMGYESQYLQGPWKFQSEYMYGKTEPAVAGPSVRQKGYYVFANYIWKCLRPGLRWQSWDPDRDTSGNRQTELTAGLDHLFTQNRKNKVTLNYTARFEEGPHIKNNEVLFQAQLAF